MIEIKEKGKGFESQMAQASKNITQLFNKKRKSSKHKRIADEISKLIEEGRL